VRSAKRRAVWAARVGIETSYRTYSTFRKMCEGCGLKQPGYGLASEGKKRWCAGCGAVEGAVPLRNPKMCEGCGLKRPAYGLASEGKARWCAGCGEVEGAVLVQKQKMCEGCGLKQPN
jgi:hypothetical protein